MQEFISQSPHQEVKPVQLHIMHSWGGGLERWVQDYCNTDQKRINLVLKSIGIPGIPGQQLALYQHINDKTPIRSWQLTSPIYATSITNLNYCNILQEIIANFKVQAILVSSFIGHSLDILNTNIETVVICHDYYPFCPVLNIYFDKICDRCQEHDLKYCFKENKYNHFFPEISSLSWLPIRNSFIRLILQNKITLITP